MSEHLQTALTNLRLERDQLDRQIQMLEQLLGATAPKRRGRPPKSASAANVSKPKRKSGWTPEAKEAARKRMAAYWAERKKKAKGKK